MKYYLASKVAFTRMFWGLATPFELYFLPLKGYRNTQPNCSWFKLTAVRPKRGLLLPLYCVSCLCGFNTGCYTSGSSRVSSYSECSPRHPLQVALEKAEFCICRSHLLGNGFLGRLNVNWLAWTPWLSKEAASTGSSSAVISSSARQGFSLLACTIVSSLPPINSPDRFVPVCDPLHSGNKLDANFPP